MSTEPIAGARRHTPMKRFVSVPVRVAVVVSGTLLLAACGQQSATQRESPPRAAPVGSCSPDSAKVTGATKVAAADLDGDGTVDPVTLTADDAAGCASYLVARVDKNTQGVQLPDGDVTTYTAVVVPGRTGQLLAVTTSHPRGGSQDTLVGYADGHFGPVVGADGKSLQLPFVATDTSPPTAYTSTSCTKGGFVVQQATAHTPIGVAAAFDVTETTYTLDGLTATAGAPTKVADNVLPADLPTSYPALAKNESFTSGCSA